MATRLARYADRVIEAGWLAAAALTPLFFNVYSSRVFEPDKITLLRSIALLMAAAWLLRTLEAPRAAAAGPAPTAAGRWRELAAMPLLPLVLLFVLVYLLATALSVVPRTSFWGSYQRLQGAYTTLAYIVIFFLTWQGLHRRAQLERLLNVIVLTSLPVALYGVLQHYGLDPLPWAGDVQERVIGSLGNAIFVAAYLIMAAFVTLERAVDRFRRLLAEPRAPLADACMGAAYVFILALQLLAIYFSKSRGPWLGLLAGVYAFMLIALVALRRAAAERGPLTLREAAKALGFALLSPLAAVLPAYLAMILARRGRRWLWLSWCAQAVLAVAVLVVFNLPQSPLAPLRQVPGIGRLGQVFETETGTGRVRVLVWQGAVELLRSNPLRALVGYGPESMFVAYSPAYPADLAHYESRSAAPDRAHNETFDALITTGLIGFLAYIALFIAVFYHGLRWLGFLPAPDGPPGPRRLYLGLTIGGALLGALTAQVVDGSLRFAGVGIPVGLIAGVAVYLALAAFRSAGPAPFPRDGGTVGGPSPAGGTVGGTFGPRELLLTALLALIAAHFVEIHFGIAIAATRLYFWLALALLLALGSGRLTLEPAAEPQPVAAAPALGRRPRRRAGTPPPVGATARGRPARGAGSEGHPTWGMVAGLLGALILGTILFDITTNAAAVANPFAVVWSALTQLQVPGQPPVAAPGALALVLLTWVLGALLVLGEAAPSRPAPFPPAGGTVGGPSAERTTGGRRAPFPPVGGTVGGHPARGTAGRHLLTYAGLSLGAALLFGLLHAARLQPQADVGLVIFGYYAFVFAGILLLAAVLPGPREAGAPLSRGARALLYPVVAVAVAVMIAQNATVVRADIYYKQAWDGLHAPATAGLANGSIDAATAQRYYDSALYYYERALACAPEEDYYLLFEGKALIERAAITDDPQARLQYYQRSEGVLQRAQALNPLNTDHTANLARLSVTWAGALSDGAA
ncbi:MAG TPA: O-antigen ligase family protein, partial [Anaerolineae bacterium]|nr:O-antigen ligase family protein [Anaerolineae bacterium]